MKILAISLLVFASCKPIARDQQTLASDDHKHKVEVRLLPTESGGATLVGCSLKEGECHNLLKNKKGSDPYEFFKFEAVLTDIEKSISKQSGLRKKVLVGAATVGVGVALAFGVRASALKKPMKYINDLRGDMFEYSRAARDDDIVKKNEYRAKILATLNILEGAHYRRASDSFAESFTENIPNFSKQDTNQLREAIKLQMAGGKNIDSGIYKLINLFKAKGHSVETAHLVIIGSLMAVPVAVVGHFELEMRDNKTRSILTLFSERTPITLYKYELRHLLEVISRYLPAKIDKKGYRQLRLPVYLIDHL